MALAAQAHGVVAADVEAFLEHRAVAEGVVVAAHGFGGDLGEAGALDLRRGAGEVAVWTKSVLRPTASKICAPQYDW